MDPLKYPGIYCFRDENGEVVYVGMTTRPAEVRIKEHYCENIDRIKERLREGGLYNRSLEFHSALKHDCGFTVEMLYTVEEGDTKKILETYEMFFIQYLNPRYNSAGVICPYYFSDEDSELDWDAIKFYQDYSWETAKKKSRELKILKAGF